MSFSDDLAKVCLQAGEKCEEVARRTAIELQSNMIEKSPVGNPDLWKANKSVMYARETHNLWVGAINADLAKGEKKVARMGKKKLKENYKLKAGQNYTGGRFKSNWQVGLGSMNESVDSEPRSDALGRAKVVLEGFKPGQTIFLTNNLPYAKKLEYGHSKQAPGGMVRLTVQDFAKAVKRAVESVK
ncbi:hypothetical protein [Comamonas sp. B21-038]|uniref:hypothetical protein n=1 Tax=Comamonas sp. B21-038 TaxID=2918299 RepID=UPI001EFA8076|nr:hypothetical protein [Comamonas sp. B21-038]ULR87393.1 hypothetical protein MJ205_13055 [Comamonas sp. B21-038]